jgi:hypothetical protein
MAELKHAFSVFAILKRDESLIPPPCDRAIAYEKRQHP